MSRAWYWVIGGAVLVLTVAALIAYSNENETASAKEKAQQFSQKLEAAGLRAPHEDIIVRTLGDDGGAVCENAKERLDGLSKAILLDQLYNGADFVGRRPITADRRIVKGQLLTLETYCPETLDEFREQIKDLKLDDVIEG